MKCRICGCTEDRPCEPPCSWAHGGKRGPLCSVCEEFIRSLRVYWESSGASKAGVARAYDDMLASLGIGPKGPHRLRAKTAAA